MACDLPQNPRSRNSCTPWLPRPKRSCFEPVAFNVAACDQAGHAYCESEVQFAMGWLVVGT
eukprot:11198339-Lingulodinium_polyedra.AAC.1